WSLPTESKISKLDAGGHRLGGLQLTATKISRTAQSSSTRESRSYWNSALSSRENTTGRAHSSQGTTEEIGRTSPQRRCIAHIRVGFSPTRRILIDRRGGAAI